MLIKVTDEGFVWVNQSLGKKQVAPALWGPLSSIEEKQVMLVVRNGSVIDEAEIHTVGCSFSYEAFEGLMKLIAGRYHQRLTPQIFKIGDELHITDIPSDISESDYWKDLTLGVVTNLNLAA